MLNLAGFLLMKFMKKLLTILGFIALLTLSGCGESNANKGPRTTPTESNPVESSGFKITTVEVPTYKLFMVALEDDGKLGDKIGCGDSIVAQSIYLDDELPTVESQFITAYNHLISLKDANYGSEGLVNTLSNSKLLLDSVEIKDGIATVNLSGELSLGGACDNPRVQAQLEKTGSQFNVKEVKIMLNGKPLSEALSLK